MFASVCCLLLCFVAEAHPHHKHKHHHNHSSATSDAVMKTRTPTETEQISGHLLVNGPLPADFTERFSRAVARAANIDTSMVHVTGSHPVGEQSDVVDVSFVAPAEVVKLVENEAAEPNSDLAVGSLHSFLVAKEEDGKEESDGDENATASKQSDDESPPSYPVREEKATPVEDKGIDIDTELPYGDLEPFGREDTAQELTENAVTESDAMVDQLERAEVAEEKRSVFRALTRLRGAAITSFDGVARSQTGNIDEYNKVHKWRKTHPMHHLADEESDITKWAFPSEADLIQLKHM